MGVIQEIIDKIRKKYPSSRSYREAWLKKCGIETKINETETLILGSSHGVFAYIPQKKEYNLCMVSQDLYYSYQLYKKYAEQLKFLKNIVLFYSVFSPGFNLIKTSEAYRATHYYKIFGIEPQEKEALINIKKDIETYQKQILRIEKMRVDKNYLGENLARIKVIKRKEFDQNLIERTNSHLKNNKRPISQNPYLVNLIELAKQHDAMVTVVLSPAHEKYKELLPGSNELFKDLYEIKEQYKNMCIMDFYDEYFEDRYWIDYDHLNTRFEGAKKLTEKIRNIL